MKKLLVLFMSILLCSCASLLGKVLEKPNVELAGVTVKDANLNGATLVFNLSIENPNNVDIKVDQVIYKVLINNKEITQAATDKAISISGKSTGHIEVPLPIEYRKVFDNMKELLFAESAAYRIEGKAKMNLLSIPFSKEGSVKLR